MKKILLIAVVLIMYCGLLETEEDTSITECETQQYSVEGLPTWLLLPLPINLWEEKSYVYVKLKRRGRRSNDLDVIILDGIWNKDKNDVEITLREPGGTYHFGGFGNGNKTLRLFITEMSPFHEGTYEVETNPRDASKAKWSYCNLTMTPAAKKPVTVPDETTSCTRALQDTAEKLSNLVELYNTLKAGVDRIQVLCSVGGPAVILIAYLLIKYRRPLLDCIQRKKRKYERSTNKATGTVSNRFAGDPTEEDAENFKAIAVVLRPATNEYRELQRHNRGARPEMPLQGSPIH